MADIVSQKNRSRIMKSIKGKNTKLELRFGYKLRSLGVKYVKHPGKYFGNPDFAIKKLKTVIFVDSCFWHGCPKHCRMPSSNKDYWQAKIARNKKRDRKVNLHYRKRGYKVVRIWEHDLKDDKHVEKKMRFQRQKHQNQGRVGV